MSACVGLVVRCQATLTLVFACGISLAQSTGDASDRVTHGEYHALLVGVDSTENGRVTPRSDAARAIKGMADTLTKRYGFRAANVTVLTNAEATHDRILQAIADLKTAKLAGANDSLMVVIECATANGEWQLGGDSKRESLAVSELKGALVGSPFADLLLVGEFAPDLDRVSSVGSARTTLEQISTGGPFARLLATELTVAARANKPVTAYSLFESASDRIRQRTGKQWLPQYSCSSGQPAFVFLAGTASLAEMAPDGVSDEVWEQPIARVELDDVDIRDAIRALFKNVEANYVIAPEIQGSVSLYLKNSRFGNALKMMLDLVGATFRIEGGVFNIVKRDS